MQNLPAVEVPVKESLTEAEQRKLDRLAERETVIQYEDAGPLSRVFTCHPALARQLQRRGLKPIRQSSRTWSFEVPKSWISIRPPRRSGMTAEQKRAATERLALLKNPHHWSENPKPISQEKE